MPAMYDGQLSDQWDNLDPALLRVQHQKVVLVLKPLTRAVCAQDRCQPTKRPLLRL